MLVSVACGKENRMTVKNMLAAAGLLVTLGAGSALFAAEERSLLDASPSSQFTNLFPDTVVARGKGIEVTRTQVEDAFIAFKASLAAQGQTVPESKRADVEERVLDRLINVQALLTKATPEDRAKAKDEGEKRFAEYRNRYADENAFKRQLLALGMSVEKFRANMIEEDLFRNIIDREVRSKITITDAQVKKFYEENPERFDQPEMVRFSQVLFLTQDPSTRTELPEAIRLEKKKMAEATVLKLKAGEDFAKLAKQFSDDKAFRDQGGEMPFLTRKDMAPELEKVAFTLTPNRVSDVITTKVGFHIIKVTERKAARKVPFTETEDKIREFLSLEQAQKQLPEYLAKLREQLGVEILKKGAK